ncbi:MULTISPECIES: glutathione S-transferase family protein [unclassified Marinobacter]|uniref:glutathione S-transferase family protein n=1 Tax=unclassified Marinobacter TaxID=83889 RepID=UPI001269664D|nr:MULTISPECIES: glutathione S-transferase family protein [unclassified Marinobacter]QFS87158.1 Glutathione S-transferase GST-6.0 [Marinobacter sp. THAF197a]QFT50942.1 Glutathione S-transferase GST-6.0 [Marinobacter sp. THAF39]
MSEITFYTHPMSRGRVVRWMLEEIGVPYTVETMQFGPEMKTPEYLAINPMGKVPAIKHGNTVVTEVAAICAYLADQFPEKNLAPPPHSMERGPYYRWLFFMAGPFEMAASALAYDWKIDSSNAQAVGCGRVEDSVNTLEKVLGQNPYICGDHFTAADVLVSSYLWWETMQKNIPLNEVFQDYIKRTESRPAAQRANELDDALAEHMSEGHLPVTQ